MDVLLWAWETGTMATLERGNSVVTGRRASGEAGRLPVVFRLDSLAAASAARREVRAIAERLGAADPEAVELVAGELAANCVEHRSGMTASRLRVSRRGERLVVETWNRCERRPDWQTAKNAGERVYRVGGHGLVLCNILAVGFRRAWVRRESAGYVRTRAEFEVK